MALFIGERRKPGPYIRKPLQRTLSAFARSEDECGLEHPELRSGIVSQTLTNKKHLWSLFTLTSAKGPLVWPQVHAVSQIPPNRALLFPGVSESPDPPSGGKSQDSNPAQHQGGQTCPRDAWDTSGIVAVPLVWARKMGNGGCVQPTASPQLLGSQGFVAAGEQPSSAFYDL